MRVRKMHGSDNAKNRVRWVFMRYVGGRRAVVLKPIPDRVWNPIRAPFRDRVWDRVWAPVWGAFWPVREESMNDHLGLGDHLGTLWGFGNLLERLVDFHLGSFWGGTRRRRPKVAPQSLEILSQAQQELRS